MSYGTKHARSKLSNRLTRVYAALFSVIFFSLSVGVFLLAYQFLLEKQWDHLMNTMQLIGDNLMEEIEEGETLSNQEVLSELNVDPNLSIFIFDNDGALINRVLNFPLPERMHHNSSKSPEPFIYNGTLMLRVSHPIAEHETSYGKLNLVYSLSSETSFLKLLGVLLLGANVAGVLIALLASQRASRRMLEPIGQMISAANRIDSQTLDERLEVPEPDDELKNLATTINGMLDRVSTAYRQQGRFVADVSHELRTPLAVMQGNIDLLSRWGSEDKDVLQDSIRVLEKQTAYMNDLVDNLLFLARSDSGKFHITPSQFSVRLLFDELLEEQALIDQEHQYAVSLSPDSETLFADRMLIRQLLRALIDNSVKYTPADGEIRLCYEREEKKAILKVSDSGIGMTQEDCAHVFERFYRVDQARARATGGIGLGLSIVLAIAEAHGGNARAESKPGEGTTVLVTLPQES